MLNKLYYHRRSLPKILLLSETHLSDSKLRHLNIPNYTTLSCNRLNRGRGSVAIIVHNSLTYKEQNDLNILNKENFECIFLELKQKLNPSIIIGSNYQPPNTKGKDFIEHYYNMIKQLKKENKKEIILGMDHNLDLLKSMIHKDTQDFLDLNFNENLLPCITRPTHITKTMATLIHNVFISQNLHKTFDSCVLVHDISDHMPSLVNIHGQKHDNNEPLEFTCRSLNHDNIKQINNLLLMTDWSNLHKLDVNIAFSELQNRIDNCINAVAPVKHVTISNHKIWRES